MTIAGTYLVSDGIVIGADSTTTATDNDGNVVQIHNHAQKVFEIGADSHFAFCTFGAGKVGEVSHRTLSALLGETVGDGTTLDEVADELEKLVDTHLPMKLFKGFTLGYFLGGVSPDHTPGCIQMLWDQNRTHTRDAVPIGGALFNGMPDYFARVFYGVATGLLDQAIEVFLQRNPTVDARLSDSFRESFEFAQQNFVSAGMSDVPIREAIDYIHTFLHVTVKAHKFKFGAPICGGPLEIAMITTDRKFRWVAHKDFASAIREHTI